jgi:hypothetical protein
MSVRGHISLKSILPANMSRDEFYRWHRRRMRWILFLDTSEALLMLVTLLWGIHLCVMAGRPLPDPVSLSLLVTWPRVPLWVHGLILISVATVHALGMRYGWRGHRRWMVLTQMTWFLYNAFALCFAHVYTPYLAICSAYVLACILNYFSLLRPASDGPQEPDKCQADR